MTIAILASVALIVVAVAAPRLAAAGWLIAFVFVSAIPLGSLTWLLIHRLTGGRWGDAAAPIMRPAASVTPFLAVAFIPVLTALPLLYPWAGGAPDIAPDVRALFLNMPLFLARSTIAFIGWSGLAIVLTRMHRSSTSLFASVGLLFHAVMMSLMAIDWILSVEPLFISSSFGSTVAITQLLAALSFAVLVAPTADPGAARDLGGLMLAVTLGITYLNFMAVLVIWYGDLPDKVFWLVARIHQPWIALAIACYLMGSLVPIALLLFARVRQSHTALRCVAVSSLAGIALYDTWLLVPVYGAQTFGTAALSTLVLACALALLSRERWLLSLFRSARTAP
jgi:hypothetical protein